MPIETRLTRDAVLISVDAPVEEAAHLMGREAVGCLVCVDADGKAAGMLTDRDLALRVVGRTCDYHTMSVSDVMTTDLVAVSAEDRLETIVGRMKTRGVRRVPVLENDRPVSLVSLDDILQLLAAELHDLGTEARQRYRHSTAAARYEHLREGTEHRLEEIGHRLAFANWFVRKSFVDELDSLRDRLRKAVGGD
ncbi:MAG: CBS domain-containing protein [Planctomycetes bacterium]|nr:CBS domain-containing protein [Planctomycetota bacterium]MCB9904424.1 CBS domain-containing protein [Planctomycetota bacterium]